MIGECNLKVSVVLPCYNCEKYIVKTIKSILSQTVKPIEIILVNDASTDNTLEILREKENKYSEVIKVINLKNNKGVSHARNCGVENSNGSHILFMDSDDIAEPKLIEKHLERLEELNFNKKERYILCYSAYIQTDEIGNQVSEVVEGIQFQPEEALGYEFIRNHISTSGVLVNKEFFIESGGFNKNINLSEDWDLWLRLAAIGGFAYVDEPLVRVRRHGKNASSNINKMIDAEKNVLKQYNIEYIKNAIFKRDLEIEANTVDYASILFRLDKWEEGYLELKELQNKGHDFYNIYFYLGLYYLKKEDFRNALKYFNKTINLKSNHGAALNNAGALLILNDDKNKAKEYLNIAMGYFPSYMDAKHNYKLLDREKLTLEDLKFTWRELRKVLLNYSE